MVYAVRDYETPDSGYIETKYDYDLANRIVGVSSTNGEKADYVYDERNNLKSMAMTVDGVLQDIYTYDGLNQLIRHDDAKANKSYRYIYDNGGNIRNKITYAYTTGELGDD